MKRRSTAVVVLCLAAIQGLVVASNLFAAGEDNFYKLGPDSLPQDGVPKGKLVGPLTLPCEAYPGTQHTYWVYVPAQYDPAKPGQLDDFQRWPGDSSI